MDTDEVTGRFGAKAGAARRELIKFMTAEDAGKEGRIFKGGGLVRSAGGMKALREISKEERWAYDERILGTGSFVESVLAKTEPPHTLLVASEEERQKRFEQLVHKICGSNDIDVAELASGTRRREMVKLRRALCYLAVRKIGLTSASVARQLNISGVAVLKSVDAGKSIVDELKLNDENLL